MDPGKRTAQRPHKPRELGPRLFRRGRYWWADLRPWGGERIAVRNPAAAGWPARGDRTEDRDIADRWRWRYVEQLSDNRRRLQLGKGPAPRPIGEAVQEFLEHRDHSVEWNTRRNDRTALSAHLVPYVGASTPTDEIDAAVLQKWVQRLTAAGYQPATVHKMLQKVRSLYEWLTEGRDDPTRGVKLRKLVKQDVHAWSDTELEQLRDAADVLDRAPSKMEAHRALASYRLALELGLATGGRVAELFALDWGAFRQADRTVRFRSQLMPHGHGLKALKGKTARTTLVLPSWWEHHTDGARGRVLLRRGVVSITLFSTYDWINDLYDQAELNAAGRGWHTLRHTYARLFVEMGGRLEELQKSLGHTSIATTERYYGHLTEDSAALLARQRIYQDSGPRLVRERQTEGAAGQGEVARKVAQ